MNKMRRSYEKIGNAIKENPLVWTMGFWICYYCCLEQFIYWSMNWTILKYHVLGKARINRYTESWESVTANENLSRLYKCIYIKKTS